MDQAESSPELAKKASPTGWGPLKSLFITFGAYIASQVVVAIFIILITYTSVFGLEARNVINTSSWLQLAYTLLSSVTILLILKLFLKIKGKNFKDLGFGKFRLSNIGWLALGVLVYYGLLVLAIALISLIPGFDANQSQQLGYQNIYGWQLGIAFVGLVIIPAFAEESLFRGFLYRSMSARWPRLVSAIVVSGLFAAAHMQWNVAIDVLILSLVMIVLLEKTNNLWVCIFLHGIKNFLAFLALFVFAKG
jgi:uncharacterized protein